MRRAMISKALWHAVLSMWLHFPACVGGILLRPNGFLMIVLIPDIQSWQHMRAVECHLYDRSKITGFQRLPSAHFPKIQDAPWTWCRAAVSELKSLSHNIAQSYQISVKVFLIMMRGETQTSVCDKLLMNVAVLSGPIPLAHQSSCFLQMLFRVTLLASAFEGERHRQQVSMSLIVARRNIWVDKSFVVFICGWTHDGQAS